jgi:hypothetical protein
VEKGSLKRHREIPIHIKDEVTTVDEEIVTLIQEMNQIPGVETTASCQGQSFANKRNYVPSHCSAYVAFDLSENLDLPGFIVNEMVVRYGYLKMEEIRTFAFEFELDNEMAPCVSRYIFRWSYESYKHVLEAIRKYRKMYVLLDGEGNGKVQM